MRTVYQWSIPIFLVVIFSSCKRAEPNKFTDDNRSMKEVFGDNIIPYQYDNYEYQNTPEHIEQMVPRHKVLNHTAALGRALFYDKKLSYDNTISCASCHRQENAFGLRERGAKGVNGTTKVQSMRLVNLRYSGTSQFFWDGREDFIDAAVSSPILNHTEMGYSGTGVNDHSLGALIDKLNRTRYYSEFFKHVYGTPEVTMGRIKDALSSFVFSLESYDSKYDQERAKLNSESPNAVFTKFSGFTEEENTGKDLFFGKPYIDHNGVRLSGGLACSDCHFDGEIGFVNARKRPQPAKYYGVQNNVTPLGGSNGISRNVDNTRRQSLSKRSPGMRDLVNNNGAPNSFFFSSGSASNLEQVIDHYDNISQLDVSWKDKLDGRLVHANHIKKYNITKEEKSALITFLKTLSGSNIYTDKKWSDPFLK